MKRLGFFGEQKSSQLNSGENIKSLLRWQDLLALLRLTRKYKKEYAWMLLYLVLQMVSYQGLAYSLKYLINDLLPLKEIQPLVYYGLFWIAAFLVHSLFTLMAARYRITIVRSLIAILRAEIVRKLQIISIKYFDTRGTGRTSAKFLMDMDRVQSFFDWFLTQFLQAVFGMIIVIPFLFSIDSVLAIVTLLYVPTIPILQQLFQEKLMKHSYELRNTNARFSEKLVDYISGIKQIRVFANEDVQSARILKEVNSVRDVDIHFSMVMRCFLMAIQFFSDFMPIFLWVLAGVLMINDPGLTLGAVVAYVALVRQFLGAMHILFSSFDQVVAASPSVGSILEMISANELENQKAPIQNFEIDGSIKVENLYFSYETRPKQQHLLDITIDIAPGEKVAFVGESGSGKSTLVNVLLGLYPATSGNIYYGAYHINQLNLKKLRSQIAIMSQETFLFNTTILDNINFANLQATREEVIEACRKAEILEFIESLPEKFDTPVGERGMMLSGGQRQRIGLARVLLRKPRIIILDEPSSALDVITEQKLFDTLYHHIQNITLIIIAHRLSTIKQMGRVYVFQNGTVVEKGRFDELAVAGGLFSQMVKASVEDISLDRLESRFFSKPPGSTISPSGSRASEIKL